MAIDILASLSTNFGDMVANGLTGFVTYLLIVVLVYFAISQAGLKGVWGWAASAIVALILWTFLAVFLLPFVGGFVK